MPASLLWEAVQSKPKRRPAQWFSTMIWLRQPLARNNLPMLLAKVSRHKDNSPCRGEGHVFLHSLLLLPFQLQSLFGQAPTHSFTQHHAFSYNYRFLGRRGSTCCVGCTWLGGFLLLWRHLQRLNASFELCSRSELLLCTLPCADRHCHCRQQQAWMARLGSFDHVHQDFYHLRQDSDHQGLLHYYHGEKLYHYCARQRPAITMG